MIVVGAGGLAKQLFDEILFLSSYDTIFFFDDFSSSDSDELFGRPIYNDINFAIKHFREDPRFVIAFSGAVHRKNALTKFQILGGKCIQIISQTAQIAKNVGFISNTCTIMSGVIIESSTVINDGVLINNRALIHHDVCLGEFCEIAPNACILGNVIVESNVFIGANAVILPGLHIGSNAVIGAGSVVTKNVMHGTKVVGNPAKYL